jgi:hypothetical protein
VVCGDTFETTDGDRFFIRASAPAGLFTGAVTDTAQYAGENITFPVKDVSIGKVSLGNLPYVLRYIRMRRAGPLAVYDLVVIIRVISIRGLHF